MKVLVTGGAGYIGSHTIVELVQAGHEVVAFDNLCNSSAIVFDRIAAITGQRVTFVHGDLLNAAALDAVFQNHPGIDAVIHFAGLKSVSESVSQPLTYYHVNITGTLHLLAAMERAGVRRLIFSSSATVYEPTSQLPINEGAPLGASSPYGYTKLIIEQILRDHVASSKAHPWQVVILRYFNPVGAHPSGLIGEAPNGIPNNLMPFITQVAVGKLECLSVFGDDYPTHDGTGVRDFVHVVDLARGHLASLAAQMDWAKECPRVEAINLGTGRGYSVLELVKTFERISNREVPYVIRPRRPGDLAEVYADPSLAERLLGWRAEFDLERMCVDAWRWQLNNPNGYDAAQTMESDR